MTRFECMREGRSGDSTENLSRELALGEGGKKPSDPRQLDPVIYSIFIGKMTIGIPNLKNLF